MTLLQLAALLALLFALLWLSIFLYLGVRFYFMCGSYGSAVKVIDALEEAAGKRFDDARARPAFKAANKYFPGSFL